MVDAIYLVHAEQSVKQVVEIKDNSFDQSGIIHSKIAGKYEIVTQESKNAQSFDDMFNNAEAFGKIRAAYIDSAHKISPKTKYEKRASTIGGEFGLTTAQYNNISFNAVANVSQSIEFLNPSKDRLNEDFFGKDVSSYAYLSQFSIDYEKDNFKARLGRIKIETPYANSDDIRMAANTFEGVDLKYDYNENFKTDMFFINRWAGYDSQDEDGALYQNEFKKLVDGSSFGMVGASLIYKYAKESEATLWYNYIDEMCSIIYAEIVGIYFSNNESFHIDYGLQASIISEINNSNVDGNVYGGMLIFHYNNIFLGGAYNIVLVDEDKYITNGFGGGSYYTSLDEATISAISEAIPGENAKSVRVGLGYEFKEDYLDGAVLELVYGKLYNGVGAIYEKDIILSYDYDEKLRFEATYTKYDSSGDKNNFDRYLLRLDYNF